MLSIASRPALALGLAATFLLLPPPLVQAGYEKMERNGECVDSEGKRFNRAFKYRLGVGYLATCQAACDAIKSCIGISVWPEYTVCYINGEGMKSTDVAAVEQASGSVGGWYFTSNS